MEEVFQRGGVRIGQLAHATWPFCDIRVNNYLLELNASIIGKLVFRPGDVEDIQVVDGFFKGKGLRIIHRVPGYKSNVLFQLRSSDDPHTLLEKIKSTGFLEDNFSIPLEYELIAEEHQRTGIFSMKPAFAIGIIVIWNLLAIVNIDELFHGKAIFFGPPSRMIYAFGFLILTTLSLLFIPKVGKVLLKPGRSVKDLRFFLLFLLFIFSLFFCLDFLIPHTVEKHGAVC